MFYRRRKTRRGKETVRFSLNDSQTVQRGTVCKTPDMHRESKNTPPPRALVASTRITRQGEVGAAFTGHYLHRIKWKHSPLCIVCGAAEDIPYVLFSCSRYSDQRDNLVR